MRDCENCKHHSDAGCSQWDCTFDAKIPKDTAERLNCQNCKYLFRLKEYISGKWGYKTACCLYPITEPDDKHSFALVIDDPEKGMCEMFERR